MVKARLEKIEQVRVVYRGLTQAARALGCSRAHLSYVLHGQRKPSERLARQLRRMGVEVEG
ncbi:MAG: helix-turn-helix transcriptional regulator [Kiritimatiellae bacterium]|nr:helix-turn-helix transcriptional regulator [Kiritimatiellia bacterium]